MYCVIKSRFVSNKDVGTKIFDRLGDIMYAMSDNEDVTAHLIKEFMEEFKEENKFIEYFQKIWCYDESRIGKIIKVILNIFYVFI